jgi:hypothetical protein
VLTGDATHIYAATVGKILRIDRATHDIVDFATTSGLVNALAIDAPTSSVFWTVSFRTSPDDSEERRIPGRIVRVERLDDDPRSAWPHRMAIEFAEPVAVLEGIFKRASSRPPPDLAT